MFKGLRNPEGKLVCSVKLRFNPVAPGFRVLGFLDLAIAILGHSLPIHGKSMMLAFPKAA
jgi:hypothetical protein